MSRISTLWRSVSKNTRGAPPVYAALWNTGLVSERVMKVSAALTSAELRSAAAGRSGIKDSLSHGVPPVSVWPTYGRGFHGRRT